MSQDMRVALTTSLNDQLVGPLRRALDEVERNLAKLQRDLGGVTQASTQANRAMAGMEGPSKAAKAAADLSRETQQAIGLAERLQGAWNKTGAMVRSASQLAAGAAAARYVMKEPLQKERSYTRQLADASNVAYADRKPEGRTAGIKELDTAVTGALRQGGGKREDVLEALNTMVASGTVSVDAAKNTLPTIAKYATAGNALATDLSQIVVKALQSGFKEADIPKILDMALAAGQQGGFELKDMAKWLPKLLSAGKTSGLGGMEGYARILGSSQASLTTAGSKDEAGNNLLNLLLKINSSDTANDAKKLGIDLAGSLSAARGKGVNSLDAFVNMADQIAAKDPRMTVLRKQAANAGNTEERKATLNAQADILQGSAVGKIVQDRQALMALIAEMNQRDYIKTVSGSAMKAEGQYGRDNFQTIAKTADFQIQQKDNEQLFAQTRALTDVNGGLGKLATYTAQVYQLFPGFATALEGSKLAVMAMAAAATGAAASLLLLGGSKAGLITKLLPTVATTVATVAPVAAGLAPVVAAGTAATAATGAVAAGAGAGAGALAIGGLAVGGAVLGAGVLMNEAMNSEQGLKKRVASRQERYSELSELAKMERSANAGGSTPAVERLEAQAAAMRAERDALVAKLSEVMVSQQEMVREIGALSRRSIELRVDGSQLTTSVNERNTWLARRQ